MFELAETFSAQPFQKSVSYHEGSDSLFVKFKPGPVKGERIDGRLTVLRDLDTREIIGAQIKGYRAMSRTMAQEPGFKIWTAHNKSFNVGYMLMRCVLAGEVSDTLAIHYIDVSKHALSLEAEPVFCASE
jgi:hypothetical protein